jgi:hypothetical protein
MKKSFSGAILLFAMVMPVYADIARQDSQPLTGSDIQALFQNKELTDRVHYKYVFHTGGHLDGVEMSSHFTGKWYIQQDQLCWIVDDPQATEECFVVKKEGEEFHFSSDRESWQGFVYPIDVAPPPEKI